MRDNRRLFVGRFAFDMSRLSNGLVFSDAKYSRKTTVGELDAIERG